MDILLPPEVERLVQEALRRDASDLFLIPGEPPTLRLRGNLERLDGDVLSAQATQEMARAMIGEDTMARIGPEIGEFQRSCGRPGEFNLCVCVARTHGEYTLALRVMSPMIFGVEGIKLPKAVVDAALSLRGLVVFSGAVGSGKTTALYSLVDHINTHVACHICTVEGPSHLYVTPKKALVQQREIGVDVPTCLAGIRAAMAQDLDVLFVGEIMGAEELQACMTVAETGHLVLMQLHSPSPEAAVHQMIDMFPEDLRSTARKSLACVLRSVCAQRLLPKADGHGRVAAYGVIIPDDELRAALAAGNDFMARKTPWHEACQTIEQDMERLRMEGIISEESTRACGGASLPLA